MIYFLLPLHRNMLNMLNLHWNGDVFNQGFVISPRTGVLHACLSPKRQTLTTLASGEKWFLFPISLAIPVLLYGRLNNRLNYIPDFGNRRSRRNVSLVSTDTHLQRYLNWFSAATSGRSYDFLSTTRCCACGDKQPWGNTELKSRPNENTQNVTANATNIICLTVTFWRVSSSIFFLNFDETFFFCEHLFWNHIS